LVIREVKLEGNQFDYIDLTLTLTGFSTPRSTAPLYFDYKDGERNSVELMYTATPKSFSCKL